MSEQLSQKKSISAQPFVWEIAENLVKSRQFKSISEVVQEGIRLVDMQVKNELTLLYDDEFDKRVLASIERIARGEAIMRTPAQVAARINNERKKRLQKP